MVPEILTLRHRCEIGDMLLTYDSELALVRAGADRMNRESRVLAGE